MNILKTKTKNLLSVKFRLLTQKSRETNLINNCDLSEERSYYHWRQF